MRRVPYSRKLLFFALALALLAGAYVATLPPLPRTVSRSPSFDGLGLPPVARGAYHVHSTRSDGSGTVDQIAAAAARAGLQFVIFTDHGDGMRAPLPPSYRTGVLCLDGVEISTDAGHYVALGLPQTPYRLAGAPRDVVEDVTRMGGFGVIAHPDSPKDELAWRQWALPFQGLEWINLDTEWRDESRPRLALALAQHLARPAEALAGLIAHDGASLTRWDRLARDRRVVALAAVDAHARFDADGGAGHVPPASLAVPSYETSFRTLNIGVELPQPLSGQAAQDARILLGAIAEGRVLSALVASASPGRLDFAAEAGERRARMGQFLAPSGEVRVRASADAPDGSTLRLICDGRPVAEAPASTRLAHALDAVPPGTACRLEVGWHQGGRFVRWVVTNPIYLRGADTVPPSPVPLALAETDTLGDRTRGASWGVEHDEGTQASRTVEGIGLAQRVTLRYALRGGKRSGQFAAVVTPDVEALARLPVLAFTAQADRPMRLSVQVREPVEGGARRWRRSVYIDVTPVEVVLRLEDFEPVQPERQPHPAPGALRSLLFVVDTEHSPPGTSGSVSIERIRVGAEAPAVTPAPGA